MTPWRRSPGSNNLAPSIKRRSERYLLSTRLTATVHSERHETTVQSRALDISESGIGTLAGEGLGVGTHVDLEVALPENACLKIEGIVRHRTGRRCGMEFLEVSVEQRQLLRNACKFLAR
jgi:c-di-GMP-binding flagellar brake protein YcgR